MKNKSNRYFPETFVYNEVLCQRGKSLCLSSLSICQSIAFFLLHFLLYFNRGGKKYLSGNVTDIECSSPLSFYFMVHCHQNVEADMVLRSYRLFFNRNSPDETQTSPSLIDSSLALVRYNQWNGSTSSNLKN